MNRMIKLAFAAAGLVASAQSFAVGIPNSGSSDLLLFVGNTSTSTVYALDTGISVGSAFNNPYVTNAVLNTSQTGLVSQTIAASSALQAFLSSCGGNCEYSLSGYQMQTSGGSATTTNIKNAGQGLGVFTSNYANTGTTFKVTNIVLSSFVTGINNNNGLYVNAPSLSSALGSGNETSTWTPNFNLLLINGGLTSSGTVLDWAPVGTTATIYGITGSGGGTIAKVQSYILGTEKLTSNGLQITGNGGGSTVPVPGAVWLLGSGLLGLVGVSRRRAA